MGQWKYVALAALLSGCASSPVDVESFECAEAVSPAHPSVVLRTLYWLPAASRIETSVFCGVEDKQRCQAFIDDVSRHNDAIREMGYPEERRHYMYEVIQTLREAEWGA